MVKLLKSVASFFIRQKKKSRIFFEKINILFYYLIRPFQVSRYLKKHKVFKLQIGTGTNVMEGWLNTELYARQGMIYLDATKTLPFENESFILRLWSLKLRKMGETFYVI
jgi:hypothetical protein